MPRYAESTAQWTSSRLLVLPAFAVLYWYVVSHFSFNAVIALVYVVASIIAFMAYALDKSAAKQGRWRISESTLHLMGLACGWPGALLAQQLLRHKTTKSSFVSAFWATVLLNSAGFYAWHTPWAAGLRL
jgi:uncharacterized membrane protein YsdA (DUF1294 family)